MRFVALAASVFGWIRAYGAGTFLRPDTVSGKHSSQPRSSALELLSAFKEKTERAVSIVPSRCMYRPRARNYSRWIVLFGNVFRPRHHFDSLRGAPSQRRPPNAVRVRLKNERSRKSRRNWDRYGSACRNCPTVGIETGQLGGVVHSRNWHRKKELDHIASSVEWVVSISRIEIGDKRWSVMRSKVWSVMRLRGNRSQDGSAKCKKRYSPECARSSFEFVAS